MTTTWKTKITEQLEMTNKADFESFENLAEGLMDELTDDEQEASCWELTEMVEEWWEATDYDEEDEADDDNDE